MHKVCKRKEVRDPAPADSGEGRCAGSRRPRPPGAKAQLRSQDRRGWEGRVSQALPSIQSCPHSNPGPEDGEGRRFPRRALNPEGAALSVFHTCPLPPPTGCLSHPGDRLSRQGGVRVYVSGSSPLPPASGWHGYREPSALARSLFIGRAARPRAGLGQGRRSVGRPQEGAARIPVTVPSVSSFKLLAGEDRVLPAPSSLVSFPRRGTHLQSPSHPGGQQEQCQAGQHRDPAWATECSVCEWKIRSTPAVSASSSPPRSPVAPALALLPVLSPPAAEETDGAGARRRGSQPGESADPAHPVRHPRETPSGAPESCARAQREATGSPQVWRLGHQLRDPRSPLGSGYQGRDDLGQGKWPAIRGR